MKVSKDAINSTTKYQEEDTKTGPSRGLVDLIKAWASMTAMHGVSHLQNCPSVQRRVVWVTAIMLGVGVLSWQMYEAVKKLASNPTSTKLEYSYKPLLPFPAVTICNVNPIRRSSLVHLPKEMRNIAGGNNTYSGQETSQGTTSNAQSNGLSTDFTGSKPPSGSGWEDSYSRETTSPEVEQRRAFMKYYSMLSTEAKRAHGHNISWLLLSCKMNGYMCGPRDFTLEFNNYMYGNCFTLNYGEGNSTLLETTVEGPLYGLSLELFIEQYEYISMTLESGVRFSVHNQREMPFPEDSGYSAKPGTVTYARVVRACQKTCYQQQVVQRCHCGDSSIPMKGPPFRHLNVDTDKIRACDYSVKKEEMCLRSVRENFSMILLGCDKDCPPPCREVDFITSTSVSGFPPVVQRGAVITKLMNRNLHLWETMKNMSEKANLDFVTQNMLKLKIYYGQKKYEVVSTIPSYEAMDFISDLGGQMGLWVGLSMLTMVELLEVLVDALRLLCSKCRNTGMMKSRGTEKTEMNMKDIRDAVE